MYTTLKTPLHLRMPGHHRMLLPAALVAIAILLLPALVAAQAALSGSTLRAVGTTVNGSNAGTSGTDPGFSSGPQTAGQPSATSQQTLGAVGTNVNGLPAGTSGTNPGVPTATTGNPLNRNPENRIPVAPEPSPSASGDTSAGAASTFGSRDAMVAPDPTRDSVRTQ